MLPCRSLSRILTRALLALAVAAPARACDVALVLAMDVSGSVDAYEYQLQMQGLAHALRDPEVSEAIVHGRVALAVLQWSGTGEQSLVQPWARPANMDELRALAARIATLPRAHAGGNTAVGEALGRAAALFAETRDCARWVIDVSGDGDENAGFTLPAERRAVWRRGIVVNGLAIEGAGTGVSITGFYRRHVTTPGGFVITAFRHEDFARAMREKLLRELVTPLAQAPAFAPPAAAGFLPG